jgi:hypothetical protein
MKNGSRSIMNDVDGSSMVSMVSMVSMMSRQSPPGNHHEPGGKSWAMIVDEYWPIRAKDRRDRIRLFAHLDRAR